MKMPAKRGWGIALLFLLLALQGLDVFLARLHTPKRIEAMLKSDQCLLTLDQVGMERLQTLLTVEDPTFYENQGLDFETPGAGLTTLSQSLGKLLYFNDYRPGIRKIRLIYLTRFALFPLASKKDILTLFINYAYLGNANGHEVRGFAHASESYFRKPFNQLSEDEYVSLVAMLISPNQYHVLAQKGKNRERVIRIKRCLKGQCRPLDWQDDQLEGCK